MLNRRMLLASAGATIAAAAAPWPTCAAAPQTLTAKPSVAKLMGADGPETPIWGYDGRAPGPTLRMIQGQKSHFQLVNALPQPTTIHGHGVRIDNAMDGVAGLTQEAVEPGGVFDYAFEAPDAGSYWHHPHNRTWEQMARGLYGPLIVEEAQPPAVDRDLLFVVDDWRLDGAGAIDEESLGALHDWAHAGRLGDVLTVNGLDEETIAVRQGERIRLRVMAVTNARVLYLRFNGHSPIVIAYDGQPLNTPEPLKGGLVLAPAQRADLVIDMVGEPGPMATIDLIDPRSGQAIGTAGRIIYRDEAAIRPIAELGPPAPLPPNPLDGAFAINAAQRVSLVMEGGAMGGLCEAMHKGELKDIRAMAAEGAAWAFNGVAGMTDQPLFSAKLGETVLVTLENQTRWPHGMHFHGHHVRTVGDAGFGPWRDAVLLNPMQSKTVAMKADNPGRWMLHCHMLEHQAGGMGTWFSVG